jgi:hypothetical protein
MTLTTSVLYLAAVSPLILKAAVLGVWRLVPLLPSGPVRWIHRSCGTLFALKGALLLATRRQGA